MTIYRGLTLVYTNGNPISGLSDDTMFHDFGQGFFMGIASTCNHHAAGICRFLVHP